MTSMTIYHAPSSQSLAPRLSALGRVLALPLVWIKRVRQRRELMGLMSQPDYLLKDVGLQRDEITREGLKPFWMR
jgi:uncharacterized protein YjiS (DUF1127 family)